MVLLLFKIILALVCVQSAGADIKTLYVVVHAPFPDDIYSPGWEGGPSLVPGVMLAVELINNRSDIISDYYLKLIVSDSGCNLHLKARVSQVKNVILGPEPIVGIIGPACSEAALATAKIQNRLQMIQITTATTPLLDDHMKYPFTFGIVSSSSIYADAILQLMIDKYWTRVAILYEINRQYHAVTYTRFLQAFPPEVVVFASGITPSYIPLEEVWEAKTRVIIVLASTTQARHVMCLAYHQDLLFPSFQFVFIDRQRQFFVKRTTVSHRGKTYKCSKDEMVTVINGVILNHYNLDPVEPNTTLVAQSTFTDYKAQYGQKLEEYGQERNESISRSIWANPFYDATWALALSLNSCIPELANNNFTNLLCIRNEMYNVDFLGTTGNITFDNVTGHARTVVDIYQVRERSVTLVGYYSGNEITLNGEGSFIESSFKVEFVTLPLIYGIATLLVAAAALVLTIFFHVINIWKCEHSSIKATSPKLNNFAFVGCYMVIASMVLVQIGFSGDVSWGLCNALIWCYNISYTLILGTILVKCWRLYRIFHHTFKKGKILSDGAMMLVLTFLVALDIALCTVRTLVNPVMLDEKSKIGTGATEVVIRVCHSEYDWFFITEAVYKALLTLTVVCLSTHNRHIMKKNFKHTKSTNVLVYLLTVLLVLGVPLYMVISDLFIVSYVVVFVILSGMVFLEIFLLFLPPSIPLLMEWMQSIKQKYFKSSIAFISLNA